MAATWGQTNAQKLSSEEFLSSLFSFFSLMSKGEQWSAALSRNSTLFFLPFILSSVHHEEVVSQVCSVNI